MKTKFQIKSFGGSILFEYESENNNLKKTLEKAVAEKKDLRDAYLRGAYLRGAYLSGADLGGADLRDAYLCGAYLRGADLSGADLSGANLDDAYLRGAYLRGAYLRGAYLRGAYLGDAYLGDAYLRGAYLRGAYLSGADLGGAYLGDAYLSGRGAIVTDEDIKRVKDDLFEVLTVLNGEVPALLESLRAGKINGSCYQGECACLVGTIANIKHCHYEEIPGIKPNGSRPIEKFFLSIRPGHTPENSGKCKEIEGWILEYMEKQKA